MVSNSVEIKFLDNNSSYVDVIVLRRDVDCSSLDEATFVEYIMHDVVQANKNLADFRNTHGYLPKRPHFFDFKADPTYFGIPYNCIINDTITEEQAKGCFAFNKDVSYFKNAKGWVFMFKTKLSEMYPSFRAEVKLILPDDVEAARENAERRFHENVSSFLADVTYFGD